MLSIRDSLERPRPVGDHPRCGSAHVRFVIAIALSFGIAACRSNLLPPSVWPPPDFTVEFREAVHEDDRGSRIRSFRVWPDGLALYAEAQAELPGLPWSQPVFDTLSIYRLDPRSTRSMGRALQRAGLFEGKERPSHNDGSPRPELSVTWVAFGNQGRVGLDTHDRSVLERSVEAIAGYLPARVRFLDIEASAEHVSDVPEPRRSAVAAVGALRELARAHPRDFALVLDLFVAAVAVRDWRVAREALIELTHEDASEALTDDAELIDWRKEALPKLRALLPTE